MEVQNYQQNKHFDGKKAPLIGVVSATNIKTFASKIVRIKETV